MFDHGYTYEEAILEYDRYLSWFKSLPDTYESDADHFRWYRNFVVKEFAAVDNDESKIIAKYSDADWMEYNIRGGVASIVGEIGEMIAMWYYRKTGHEVSRCTKRSDQVLGRDIRIKKKRWEFNYTVSVKVRKVYGDNTMPLRSTDFIIDDVQHPYPVHRIMYVILNKGMLFQCDYDDIRHHYKTTSEKNGYAKTVNISTIDFKTFNKYQTAKVPI